MFACIFFVFLLAESGQSFTHLKYYVSERDNSPKMKITHSKAILGVYDFLLSYKYNQLY